MPPIKKFTKEEIIDVAYQIVKEEGFSGLNARRVAKELKASVQPIFHNFKTMDELNHAVYERILELYHSYMFRGEGTEKFYKQIGISYVCFARDYPEFFKVLFMQKTDLKAAEFLMADACGDRIIQAGQELTGFSFEEQKRFHVKVWIFTHGIACLVATGTIQISDEEIDEWIGKTVLEMLKGYQLGKEKNEK